MIKVNHQYSAKEKLLAMSLLENCSIYYVAHRFNVHVSTIYRWKEKFNGCIESLENKSTLPKSKHPNSHTCDEIKHIKDLLRRNPNIGLNELYGKLRLKYAYTRNPASLYRFLKKQNILFKSKKVYKKYEKRPYDTPMCIGEKWQLDVKHVPVECLTKNVPCDKRFFQYTVIDEASRERFIYGYDEYCGKNSIDFLKRAIIYFGYKPKKVQTDNGAEFTITSRVSKKTHIFTMMCAANGISHVRIKPRTPRHNGKVERSHRNDNERFYRFLKCYSLDDLNYQMKIYLRRSNNIPISTIGWLTPIEKRNQLIKECGLV